MGLVALAMICRAQQKASTGCNAVVQQGILQQNVTHGVGNHLHSTVLCVRAQAYRCLHQNEIC